MRQFKVAHIALNRAFGGVERHVFDLARCMPGEWHQTVVSVDDSQLLRQIGESLPYVDTVSMPLGLGALPRLHAFLRTGRYDLVHLHGPRAVLLGRLATLLMKRHFRLVSTSHGWVPSRLRWNWAYQAIYRLTNRTDDLSILVSPHLLQYWPLKANVRVIPNGIEPVRANRSPNQGICRFLYLGRVVREKGLQELVEAIGQLESQYGSSRFHVEIIGDGDFNPFISQMIWQKGLQTIRQRDSIDPTEVPLALSEADIVVLPSYEEGFPYVVLEALAAGCGVVASTVGGVPGVVHEGVNGFLVPPRDPRALADVLSRLVTEPDLVQRLCDQAPGTVDAYRLDAMVAQLAEAYSTLLA